VTASADVISPFDEEPVTTTPLITPTEKEGAEDTDKQFFFSNEDNDDDDLITTIINAGRWPFCTWAFELATSKCNSEWSNGMMMMLS